jgi:alpha-beta hydrolase superfamily lysophospholipase
MQCAASRRKGISCFELAVFLPRFTFYQAIQDKDRLIMKVKFNDPAFSFQFLRLLGSAASRQADVGECFATASRIVEGDFESWTREWTQTAERVALGAKKSASSGLNVSAADAYLRAANYYRAAEFYLHGDPDDPRIQHLSGQGAHCFREALRLGGVNHRFVDIPYDGATLPGIFHPASSQPGPVLIAQTGFDGTIEGLFPWAQAATRRGWHCLTFEGPGQGRVIRKQGLPFRPDWEHVISAVIDYLVTQTDVDAGKIALLGVSFGGYLAPRAAAFEKRIAACIANGGVLDFIGPQIPKSMTREQYASFVRDHPQQVNERMKQIAERSATARWSQENGQYTFKAATPAEWVHKLLDYDLTPVVRQISCPMLVIDVESETNFPGEARKLYEALNSPKTWLYFTEEEGAGDHCQTGSPALAQQRIFDWLQETMQ